MGGILWGYYSPCHHDIVDNCAIYKDRLGNVVKVTLAVGLDESDSEQIIDAYHKEWPDTKQVGELLKFMKWENPTN